MMPAIFNATARMATLEDDCTINAEKIPISKPIKLDSAENIKNSLAQVDVFKPCPVSLINPSPNKSKPNARNKAAICLFLISFVRLNKFNKPTTSHWKKSAECADSFR